MSKEDIKGLPIDNLLYTKEGKASAEKTKAELELPDPDTERVLGILTNQNPGESNSEQTTN